MGLRDRLFSLVKSANSDTNKAPPPKVYPAGTGLPMLYASGPDSAEKIPFNYWDFEKIEQYFLKSDILRTTVKAVVEETFRNGVEVVEAFKYKCAQCEAKFDYKPDACPYCGGEI
ncbi:MAG TPA: hypothetical protein EYP33_08215, partial [Pyrodictium sp.]|nr:hypothetical protein [Pyrodictium sp.]